MNPHTLFHLCSGYVITYETMPVYWQWMNRISPTTWIIYVSGAGGGGRVEGGEAGRACPTGGGGQGGAGV